MTSEAAVAAKPIAPPPSAPQQQSMPFLAEELKSLKVVDEAHGVNKTECMYCYDTPASPNGLYVCLSCHLAFGQEFLDLHWEKTNHTLYLHIQRVEVPKKKKTPQSTSAPSATTTATEEAIPPTKKPTVLGIGCEGGFPTAEQQHDSEVDVEEHLSLVRIPTGSSMIYTPDAPGLPEIVKQVVQSVLKADSTERKEEIASWKADEFTVETKYANDLIQLPCAVKIPPTGPWQCQEPGCSFKENLWLNLTDGSIMCGRGNNMGLGNGHALQHYEKTKFPLAVKLGTITQDSAEIYSYEEDCSVTDKNLAKHLAFFGLDRSKMVKTDKTVAEMELDLNQKYEFNKVTEAGKKLVPVFGPGKAGIKNLGNTCYLSSVMQVLFSTQPFIERYATPGASTALFRDGDPDPSNSLLLQLAKLGSALFSGHYSIPVQPKTPGEDLYQNGIAPKTFRNLIGKLNQTFASKGQQDALEFFQCILQQVNNVERATGAEDPSRAFHFFVEERLQCGQTKQVRYSWREDNILQVPIPLEKATNLAEVTASQLSQAVGSAPNASSSSSSPSSSSAPAQKQSEPVRAIVPFLRRFGVVLPAKPL